MNLKELTKLINSGYPLYLGIGFLVLTIYSVIKSTISFYNTDSLSVGKIAIIFVIFFIGSGLGILLTKIGLEAKKDQD